MGRRKSVRVRIQECNSLVYPQDALEGPLYVITSICISENSKWRIRFLSLLRPRPPKPHQPETQSEQFGLDIWESSRNAVELISKEK